MSDPDPKSPTTNEPWAIEPPRPSWDEIVAWVDWMFSIDPDPEPTEVEETN